METPRQQNQKREPRTFFGELSSWNCWNFKKSGLLSGKQQGVVSCIYWALGSLDDES